MPDYYDDVRKKAVEIAIYESTKDTREVKVRNRGERIDEYLRCANMLHSWTPDDKVGGSWCGAFLYYCFYHAAKELAKSLPFTPDNIISGQRLHEWVRNNPDKKVEAVPFQPGDLYIKENYHVGMVVQTANDYGSILTVDGNQEGVSKSKNSVQINLRSYKQMKLLVRI
ncbi:MAG: hypothetical protein K1X72_00710 [Pyrinomonadaceae bacterium]|nr:hypothetical protein [Pyrinomonadaceae bacterium]